MEPKPGKQLAMKAARLRSRGFWSVIIGSIGLIGCIIGNFQFWLYGIVSIRPGHEPVGASDAVFLLIFIGLISLFFIIFGMLLVYRTRRNKEEGHI
ncbi:hypothetical protein ACFL4N_05120 [Thermodesulfobacteriota bacterium]